MKSVQVILIDAKDLGRCPADLYSGPCEVTTFAAVPPVGGTFVHHFKKSNRPTGLRCVAVGNEHADRVVYERAKP